MLNNIPIDIISVIKLYLSFYDNLSVSQTSYDLRNYCYDQFITDLLILINLETHKMVDIKDDYIINLFHNKTNEDLKYTQYIIKNKKIFNNYPVKNNI